MMHLITFTISYHDTVDRKRRIKFSSRNRQCDECDTHIVCWEEDCLDMMMSLTEKYNNRIPSIAIMFEVEE